MFTTISSIVCFERTAQGAWVRLPRVRRYHPSDRSHSVLTHGLSYGDDCTSLGTFVPELDSSKTKAIGVIDPYTITPEEAENMRAIGICGIRVNLYRYQAMH